MALDALSSRCIFENAGAEDSKSRCIFKNAGMEIQRLPPFQGREGWGTLKTLPAKPKAGSKPWPI
jgi:hypothetical protein